MDVSHKKLAIPWKENRDKAENGTGKGVRVWHRKSESGGKILKN